MIDKNRVNVIIDGQWGSTGKGLLAAYLYQTYEGIDLGVCDFLPNAGHTVVLNDGRKWVSRTVPVAALFRRTALIGPHAAVDLEVLRDELQALRQVCGPRGHGEVVVHPMAVVVRREDKAAEATELAAIASTAKGGHRATMRKTMRQPDALLARDYTVQLGALGVTVADTQKLVQMALAAGGTVLAETSQGFDLGLNHGTAWPYVTGRDCLVGRVLDNAGAAVRDCGSIIGSLRTFPIRVGNTAEGHSGPYYRDQHELSWGDVSHLAGRPVEETTTVTGRVRRVFTFSMAQTQRFLTFCRPTHLFLSHWDYLAAVSLAERRSFLRVLEELCRMHGCELRLVSAGPSTGDVFDLGVAGGREAVYRAD